jgi:cobalt-zinc-cadmium efflux system outer membrane protein
MRYRLQPVIRALPALVVLLGMSTAALASSDTDAQLPALTLRQAVAQALAKHPGIIAAGIDVELQQARRDTAALGTPYRLNAEVENFAGTDSLSGFDLAETTLQVAKVLELGDKRQYRTDIGDAQVGLARIETSILELEVAAEVSRRYADLVRRQQAITLAAETVSISRRTLEIVQRRVDVGRAAEAEQASAMVTLARLELIQKRLDYELNAAKVRLSTLWGETEATFGSATGDLFATPALPGYAQLDARLESNPALMRITTQSRIQQAERRLAEARKRPDIEIAAGVRHLAGPNDMGLVFSVAMPFGSGGRAEPLRREADKAIARTPWDRSERLLELRSTLYEFYQLALASHVEVTTLRAQIIPEAEKAVRFYERGFEVGRYSLLELTAAQERLLAVRREALIAASSYHLTLIEIESLLGNISPGGALQ